MRYLVMVGFTIMKYLMLAVLMACGGRAESDAPQTSVAADAGALSECGPLERQTAMVWCDREHPLAVYCERAPNDSCVTARVGTDGTGDALYCCAGIM